MVLYIAKFFRKHHREDRGFTLIELLVVIAILAVLSAIAVPLVVNRIEEARESADLANVYQLQTAVNLYVLDIDMGKTTLPELTPAGWIDVLVAQGYLQKAVKSPHGDSYSLIKSDNGHLTVKSTRADEPGGAVDPP